MSKKYFKILSFAMLALLITFTSCKKDEPEAPIVTAPTPDPAPATPTSSSSTPAQFGNATSNSDGVLVAIKTAITTSTDGQTFETIIGTGVACFSNTSGSFSSFLDAGAVTLEGGALEIQANKSYVFIPGISNPTGVIISGGADWTIAGAGSIKALNASFSRFPNTPDITSTATIKKNTAYTVSFDASTFDTALVSIFSGSVSITRGVKSVSGSNFCGIYSCRN